MRAECLLHVNKRETNFNNIRTQRVDIFNATTTTTASHKTKIILSLLLGAASIPSTTADTHKHSSGPFRFICQENPTRLKNLYPLARPIVISTTMLERRLFPGDPSLYIYRTVPYREKREREREKKRVKIPGQGEKTKLKTATSVHRKDFSRRFSSYPLYSSLLFFPPRSLFRMALTRGSVGENICMRGRCARASTISVIGFEMLGKCQRDTFSPLRARLPYLPLLGDDRSRAVSIQLWREKKGNG